MHQKAVVSALGRFGFGPFVSLDVNQQEELLGLLDLIIDYSLGDIKRPLNFYIEASPGSGKSFLIGCIIKALSERKPSLKFEYLTFNISQSDTPKDFLSLFDRISSVNASQKGIPLVFFDEVDSVVHHVYAYRRFLTPMIDGLIYKKDGGDIHFGKAIFFFAASTRIPDLYLNLGGSLSTSEPYAPASIETPKEATDYLTWVTWQKEQRVKIIEEWKTNPNKMLPDKIRDFFDRVNEFIYLPPPNLFVTNCCDGKLVDIEKIRAETRLQQVYLIASLFSRYKPHVRFVSSKALNFILYTLQSTGNRRLVESYIFTALTPQDYVLKFSHLPLSCRSDANNLKLAKKDLLLLTHQVDKDAYESEHESSYIYLDNS